MKENGAITMKSMLPAMENQSSVVMYTGPERRRHNCLATANTAAVLVATPISGQMRHFQFGVRQSFHVALIYAMSCDVIQCECMTGD